MPIVPFASGDTAPTVRVRLNDVVTEVNAMLAEYVAYSHVVYSNPTASGSVYIDCGWQPIACFVGLCKAYPVDAHVYVDTDDAGHVDAGGFYVKYADVPVGALEFMVMAISESVGG